MMFPTEQLADLAGGISVDGYTVLEDKPWCEHRWEMEHRMVFTHNDHWGRFFAAFYRRGLTEMQETEPFEDCPATMPCPEVRKSIKSIVVYE